MYFSKLTLPWWVAFVLAVCLVLGSALWTFLAADSGSYPQAGEVRVARGAASILGWVTIVIVAVRSRRAARVVANEGAEAGAATFKPHFHWVVDVAVWLWVPFAILTAVVLTSRFDLGWFARAGVFAFQVIGGPMLLSARFVRYEVGSDALHVRSMYQRTRVPWGELQRAEVSPTGLARQLRVERVNGKPLRLILPANERAFLNALREHAPRARIDGQGGERH